MRKSTIKIKKANWEGSILEITENDYYTAMRHVEYMRSVAEQDDFYNKRDEDYDNWIDPEGWKLSDTLSEALSIGEGLIGKGQSRQKPISHGLKALLEECDLEIVDPCGDEDADNVFGVE
jgi:hypothetical protein